ncbi:VTT domain-containing protein [Candidatus Woesearchaeota archaeon]|nr:VTT domain-containing protein [Candidatus Woesearchaeota archaeon]
MKKIKSLFNSQFKKRIISAVVIILTIYVLILIFHKFLDKLFSSIIFISPLYQAVKHEIASKSVNGMVFVSFFGSLFFISYPAELVFLLYSGFGYNPFYALGIMLLFIMLSQIINYYIGYFLGAKILHIFIYQTRKEYSGFLIRHDSLFIFLANVFPLPADILTAILGVVKYNFRKCILFVFLGQLTKYLILIIIMTFFQGMVNIFTYF